MYGHHVSPMATAGKKALHYMTHSTHLSNVRKSKNWPPRLSFTCIIWAQRAQRSRGRASASESSNADCRGVCPEGTPRPQAIGQIPSFSAPTHRCCSSAFRRTRQRFLILGYLPRHTSSLSRVSSQPFIRVSSSRRIRGRRQHP